MRQACHGGHERVARLALLDRSAGHRLGGVRPRGREPELARPARARGAGRHRRARRAGRARPQHPRPRLHLRQGEGLHRRRRRARVRAAAERAAGDRERHAWSTPISTASSGCRCRSCAASTASASAAGWSWRSPATGASPPATTPRASASPRCKLGIFPGFNGTARSIRQAGALAAMQMMLTGSHDPRRRRARHGLDRRAGAEPAQPALGGAQGGRAQAQVQAGAALEGPACGNGRRAGCSAKKLRAETAKKVREDHYPAPFRLIDLFETHGGNLEGMKAAETRAFAPLMVSDTSRNLRRVFKLIGDAEGPGAEGPRLQAAARARDRRRRDGRRHRRLVRRLRHGGVAAGHERRADRQGHRGAEEAVRAASSRPRPQRDAADGAPDRRSQGRQHLPRRRGDRGDRRAARGQAEPVQVDRGQAQARRGAGDQHLLDHDRGDRRAAGRSRPPDRHPLLQSGGADAAGRGHQGRRQRARRRCRRAARSSPPSTSSR